MAGMTGYQPAVAAGDVAGDAAGFLQIVRDDFGSVARAGPVGQRVIAESPVERARERRLALLRMRLGLQQPRHLVAKLGAVAGLAEVAQVGQRAHQFGQPQQLRLIGGRRLGGRRCGRRRRRRGGFRRGLGRRLRGERCGRERTATSATASALTGSAPDARPRRSASAVRASSASRRSSPARSRRNRRPRARRAPRPLASARRKPR